MVCVYADPTTMTSYFIQGGSYAHSRAYSDADIHTCITNRLSGVPFHHRAHTHKKDAVVAYLSTDFGQTVMLSFMAEALIRHSRSKGLKVENIYIHDLFVFLPTIHSARIKFSCHIMRCHLYAHAGVAKTNLHTCRYCAYLQEGASTHRASGER
jgi:hypothetical protein